MHACIYICVCVCAYYRSTMPRALSLRDTSPDPGSGCPEPTGSEGNHGTPGYNIDRGALAVIRGGAGGFNAA